MGESLGHVWGPVLGKAQTCENCGCSHTELAARRKCVPTAPPPEDD